MSTGLKITDIIVPLNDFILEPDVVSASLYICKNGGAGLLAKSANKDNTYIMEKFFGYLEPISAKTPSGRCYYYNNMKIPDIMVDFLLNNDTNENILLKIREQINANAKWMDKRGILSLVDITFDNAISLNYRKINTKITNLISSLGKYFTVHLLDNCDAYVSKKLYDLVSINGITCTSSMCKLLKCSQGDNYDIYSHFISQNKINMSNALFIETLPGYINAINNYSKYRGINVNSLLYDKINYDDFIKNLSEMLNISFNDNVGEFVINKPKSIPVQGILLSQISIDNSVIEMRKGSAIIDTFIYNGKLYEKLIQDNGDINCIVIYSDKGNDNNERTVVLPIKIDIYDQVYTQYKNSKYDTDI
jgi:hypothetical protein